MKILGDEGTWIMATVRSSKNQYRGINAHLHSHWQHEGGWDSFHTNHIVDLMRLMRVQLMPLGYIAEIEQSLQIRRFGEPAGRPESDVTIYDTDPHRPRQPLTPAGTLSETVLKIPDVMSVTEELASYKAIGIYELDTGQRDLGGTVVPFQ
jgi:hypothetical protein